MKRIFLLLGSLLLIGHLWADDFSLPTVSATQNFQFTVTINSAPGGVLRYARDGQSPWIEVGSYGGLGPQMQGTPYSRTVSLTLRPGIYKFKYTNNKFDCPNAGPSGCGGEVVIPGDESTSFTKQIAVAIAPSTSSAPQKLVFTYDTLGRLNSAGDVINGYRYFVYDPAGNRTSVIVGASGTSLPTLAAPAKPIVIGCNAVSSSSYQGTWQAVPGASYYLYSSGGTEVIVNDPTAQVAANLAAGSENPSASPINLSQFEVYTGDFDKDGISGDIYFHEKDTFIPIAMDIFVPIFLPGHNSFLQTKNVDNTYDYGTPYFLSATERASAVKSSTSIGYVSNTSTCTSVKACTVNGLCSASASF